MSLMARLFVFVAVVAVVWALAFWLPVALARGWRTAVASAYSTADSPGVQGCTGTRLRDDTLTFASLLVPCGARVRFCVGWRRCVTAWRADSGPYLPGRGFDLALGTVRALGFPSASAFGVRTVSWRRVR